MKKSLMYIVCLLVLLGAALGQTVTITAPAADSTVTTTSTRVVASATSQTGVKWMQIYLDGTKVYQTKASSIDTYLSTALGSHRLTVQAFDGQWKKFQTTEYFTVASTQPAPSPVPPVVAISAPTSGATLQSPVTIQAGASSSTSQVVAMKVYVDYQEAYAVNAASLSTSLSMLAGVHDVTVNAWDSAGNVGKSSVSITVEDPAPPPPPPPSSDPATTYNYYVSPSGNDANPGTSAQYPFRSIQKAVNLAQPSTTIHVLDGTYYENVTVSKSGTSSARIVLKSENKWGAKVKGPSSYNWAIRIAEGASYIDVLDFEITGDNSTAYGGTGILDYGNHTKISGNYVHDLVTTDIYGYGYGVGIHVPWNGQTSPKHTYNEISNNVIDNIHSVDLTKKVGECIYVGDQHNSIINNLATRCYREGIQVNHYASYNYIVGNTIDRCPYDAGIMMAVGGDSTYTLVSDGNVVANNIITNSAKGITAWQASGSTFGTNNKWVNNLTWNNGTNVSYGDVPSSQIQVSGTVTSNPMFVGSSNYRLQVGSPAINSGSNSYVIGTALDGSARMQSGTVDRGAYEQ